MLLRLIAMNSPHVRTIATLHLPADWAGNAAVVPVASGFDVNSLPNALGCLLFVNVLKFFPVFEP